MSKKQAPVDISTLSVQEILYVRKSVEEELDYLEKSIQSLNFVANKYIQAKHAITLIGQRKDGDEILIPLTSSLYVPGRVKNANKLKVDIGTGFYSEKTIEETIEFFTRRFNKVRENIEKVGQMMEAKTKDLQQIEVVLEKKVLESQGKK